jgi:hypothetical protein
MGEDELFLFIDTNIFLSFFHFSKDDLEELKKLAALLKRGRITLLLPDQVIDEFWRNRDNKIADMLRSVRQTQVHANYPRLMHEYEEYDAIRRLDSERAKLETSIMRRAEDAAYRRTFSADQIIDSLFLNAKRIAIKEEHMTSARERTSLGRPPGKRDSIGDAVNWEALLRSGPDYGVLHFVSADSDWQSPLAADRFDSYLSDEWQESRGAEVAYYQQLSLFLRKHFPDVRLASDVELWALIQAFADSQSFGATHTATAALSGVEASSLSRDQLNAIVSACVSNDQIRRLIHDSDVEALIQKVIKGRESEVDRTMMAQLRDRLGRSEDDVFWERGWPQHDSTEK